MVASDDAPLNDLRWKLSSSRRTGNSAAGQVVSAVVLVDATCYES